MDLREGSGLEVFIWKLPCIDRWYLKSGVDMVSERLEMQGEVVVAQGKMAEVEVARRLN